MPWRKAGPSADGHIPFRLRIGVTGHVDLRGDATLAEAVRAQVRRVRDLLEQTATPETPIRLAVVSQLANGGDRIVVQQVIAEAGERGEQAQLEVVLPMPRERYVKAQEFDEPSRADFEELLAGAEWSYEPSAEDTDGEDDGALYELAGQRLIARCDVLLALWDGGQTGGRGGTAETVLAAAARGKPCIWISTHEGHPVRDNLEQGSSERFLRAVKAGARAPEGRAPLEAELPTRTLEPLEDARKKLERFNGDHPSANLARRREQSGKSTEPAEWVRGAYLRATLLALKYQWRFECAAWVISGLAVAAATMLALSLIFLHEWARRFAITEGVLLAVLGATILCLHLSHWHERWLSYRLLAERLRSAEYLAPTGIDFRRAAGAEPVFVERRSQEWLQRSFEEVWASRPPTAAGARPTPEQVDQLKEWLADTWIEEQIRYHERAIRRHGVWNVLLTSLVFVFFLATIPFAFTHAFERLKKPSILLSILLPAAAASTGAVLTLRQHRALRQRSERMKDDLAAVQHDLRHVETVTGLRRASSQAALVIAQESGDWFGAMWFLDIEHPP